ncbi:MAG: biotin synthase BioB [Deltaproteobacteria bacterium]|nr:biotin synthase BioB [Deltaproteobacteria bacterium]
MPKATRKWTFDEISKIYHQPYLELIYQAATVHRRHHDPSEIQVCTLQSIKTGDCSEDCGYCSQSAHHETGVVEENLLKLEEVLRKAKAAKAAGSTRFCMGAAGRQVKDDQDFETITEMIQGVSSMGLEVCCTLGMLSPEQAKRLKKAGLYAYNHNLDTSEKFYPNIVSTRSYEDRLNTIGHVLDAGISLCCGGILGMGEKDEDRIALLATLAKLETSPESIPVNALVPIKGTPMQQNEPVSIWEVVRMIATARIVFPETMVRLSAGRENLSYEHQAMCFLAGANSIFSGSKLLTTPNKEISQDQELFSLLKLTQRKPYKDQFEVQNKFKKAL